MKNKTELEIEQINIVQYTPELAPAVAEMWNHSREGWGGGDAVSTADQVRDQEANSDNLLLLIAMEGEKDVGYCSLSEYKFDHNALYIPLLNVRDDYHGKKIGKKLILHMVNKATQLGWPRLDLFTWPGNTKAVPLYKRSGFFWEEREDSTHLMNFIPAVLNTEAVQGFFQVADWYKDSVREIEVKPDGRKENGFDYFEYKWRKNGRSLRIEFERKGRGMRLLETEDYFISATVQEAAPVFGDTYTIVYELINKSGKPLEMSLKGRDNENISFSFAQTVQVEGRQTVEASFEVGPVAEEPSEDRTHPTVCTTVLINGREAELQVGVKPTFPAKISCVGPQGLTFPGQAGQFFIDMENRYAEDVTFHVCWPEKDFLSLQEREMDISLRAKERRSVPVPYVLHGHGFYAADLAVTARRDAAEAVTYTAKVGLPFKGLGAAFSGESDKYWQICNGRYHVWLTKEKNRLIPGVKLTEEQETFMMTPKLGKPYSSEFFKKKAERVSFFTDEQAIGLQATLTSADQAGLKLHVYVRLYAEGLVEQWFEVENTGDRTQQHVWVQNSLVHDLYRTILPYEGAYVQMKDSDGREYDYWDQNKMTENWMFTYGYSEQEPRGLTWHPESRIHFANWFPYFEHDLEDIPGGESKRTKSVYVSIGAFREWQEFRAFARQHVQVELQDTPSEPMDTQTERLASQSEQLLTHDHVTWTVNDGNPIVGADASRQVQATWEDHKNAYLDGEIHVSTLDQVRITEQKTYRTEEAQQKAQFLIPAPATTVDVWQAEAKLKTTTLKRNALVIRADQEGMKLEKREEQGLCTYVVHNGTLTFKVAPDFFPGLYSLQHEGEEWLHHSFPEPTAKAWWNPWPGGMCNITKDMGVRALLKEEVQTEFVTRSDCFGNHWQGIRVSMHIQENEKYKGLLFHQYFLTLPGTPLLCQATYIEQQTGSTLSDLTWITGAFLQTAGDAADGAAHIVTRDARSEGAAKDHGWATTRNAENEWRTYHLRSGEVEVEAHSSVRFGSTEHNGILHVACGLQEVSAEMYSQKEVSLLSHWHRLHLVHGTSKWLTPVFYLIADRNLPEDALTDLERIRFE